MTGSKDTAAATSNVQETGLYLYGIGKASSSPADLQGLESDGEIARVDDGHLAAFVRTVPLSEYSEEALKSRLQDQEWLIEAARDHHAVVSTIHESVPILPAKFGAIYSSEADLRNSLLSSPDKVLVRLEEIDGCDEWALHIFREEELLRKRMLAQDPELQRLGEELEVANAGRAYLLRRQIQTRLNEAIEIQEDSIVKDVLGELQQWTRSIQHEPPKASSVSNAGDVEVARASLLVQRENVHRFLNAADDLSDSTGGIRIEITGPWPAYSFAQIDEED